MKDMTTKHKHVISSSNSPIYIIDDDDSPKPKSHRGRRYSEERHTHRKHPYKRNHKHRRHSDADSSSGDDVKVKYKSLEKYSRHKDFNVIQGVRIKDEPSSSEDEREKKSKNRHNEHSRSNEDSSRRNGSRYPKEESQRRPEYTDARGTNELRRPAKDEFRSDAEPEWGKKEIKKEKKEPPQNNAKPDFGLSGKLTEDTNTFNGVVIKYSEPPEARKPKRRWRLYPFKGETSLAVLHIHRQSAYLLGRDRKVADIPIDHPSCSKQHAALQYRLMPFTRSDGSSGRQIKLYVIDLESANGTYLNNSKIEPKRYHELKERDVVKFGFSSREYVLLHEHSKDSENDDDVKNDD